jgi:putative aminopeptidase FrvX
MNRKEFCELAERLLRQPTAPYHEHAVRTEVEKICLEHGLSCEPDAYGNLHVRLKTRAGLRPLVLAAHMDHPAFEVVRKLGPRKWLTRFRGGVPESYFRPGTRVRLMPGNVAGRLGQRHNRLAKTHTVFTGHEMADNFRFAVWDLPACRVRGDRIYARGCDDVAGVAAVLATLIRLKRTRAKVDVLGVLTRAEEVGFHGALALAAASAEAKAWNRKARQMRNVERLRSPLLPRDALIVSLETSRELPGAVMGCGVVVRTGDKTSVFDSRATRFLTEIAKDLATKNAPFLFQRALMSGGTCEATAYQEYGFTSAAVCVALGNYHNCGARETIRPEFIDVRDACGMVELLAAAAAKMHSFESLSGKLAEGLQKLARAARRDLPRTA